LHKFILSKFKGKHTLSAFVTLLLIIFTVVVPASTLSVAVVNEGTHLYSEIRSGVYDFSKPLAWIQDSLPIVSESLSKVGIDFEKLKSGFSDTALNSSHWVATNLLNIGQNALTFTVLFILMLYLLFFFLRDGHKIVELIIRVLPIGDEAERHLLSKFAEVSRATIKGTLVIGIMQGTIGGIMFALLGIESAVFWGVVMIGLSILPAVGSALVWAPAAIIFLANGHWVKALILFVVGALIIGVLDNVLRPVLVGRDTKMPDYLILLSTLGGLAIFGLSGFVVGPVIASFFLAIWVMFETEYHPDSVK
jgi:predicted PurR-regulated permease PerM